MENMISMDSINMREELTGTLKRLKDMTEFIDDKEINDNIKTFLRSASDPYKFMVIGEVNSGKSSFINTLLKRDICRVSPIPSTKIVHEIRYGVENAVFDINPNHRREFINSEHLRDFVIIDTPGLGAITQQYDELLQGMMPSSDGIFILLTSTNAMDENTWEFIRKISGSWTKKVFFLLNQVDLIGEDERKNLIKEIEYRGESCDIISPVVFPISSEYESSEDTADSGFKKLREYLKSEITGTKAADLKEAAIYNTTRDIYRQIARSFENRVKQYEEDKEIVQRINGIFDEFRVIHDQKVKNLVSELAVSIDDEIEDYKSEIIKRLDPQTITERFKNKGDFEAWLRIHNDFYKDKLSKCVEQKIQQTIKGYLFEMENVLETASNLLNEREEYLKFEDNIYGSIARTQKDITGNTRTSIRHIAVENKSLYDSSGELFMEIWKARRKSDRRKLLVQGKSATITGFGTYMLVGAMFSSVTVGSVISAAVIGVAAGIGAYEGAKKLSKGIFEGNMHKKVNEAIEKFNKDVDDTKRNMKGEISTLVAGEFDVELKNMEKHFADFRIMNYREECEILKIKEEIIKIDTGMENIGGYIQ